ncbi:MAG: EAL domain-containing protein [Gammaproteobacteria bacterium]|nr:EAL domain-containing protein [Gammaproteobacteria bacterium]
MTSENEKRILLIEESATLRYILVKALERQGYVIDTQTSFESAQARLQQAINEFDGIVIGWPNYENHEQANHLIKQLEQKKCSELKALLLTHDASDDLIEWMSKRKYTALVHWENYQELVDSLEKLLEPDKTIEPVKILEKSENSIRILFVDDSNSIRHYYKRLLERNGYITETAESVADAFEKAINGEFDLAIIDYFMPNENGYILCQKLRDDPRTQRIRSAVITGTYLDEVIRDCLQAGAVECMFKNEAEELFLARIASMSRFIAIEKSIEADHKLLASILESVGEGVYGVNNEGDITFVNPAALAIVGIEKPMPIGQSAQKTFHYHPDKNSQTTDRLYRAYGESTELRCWETEFKHSNGKAVPVECTIYPLTIGSRQEGSVVAFRDVSERKMLEEKLHWQATHDHLTGLSNRRYFEEQLEAELKQVVRDGKMSALVYLDLDRFKYINDTAGHEAGDEMLIETSRLLTKNLRENDVLARLGGDEFAIILRDVDEVAAMQLCEAHRILLDGSNFIFAKQSYSIYGSFGIAMMDVPNMTSGDVLANADIACHIAKRGGRNRSHLYEQSSDEKNIMGSELGWTKRLREAMENNYFVLYYQPILDVAHINLNNLPAEDGRIWEAYASDKDNPLHYELLLRMKGEDGAIYYPDSFIPTAERFNIMQDVDLWVINEALRNMEKIQDKFSEITFSINLSGNTINASDSLDKIRVLLEKSRVKPESLIFEVTETCAIANIDTANRFIEELKDLGCRFSLDDFGSGFCSFSQLKCLPADFVKIDGQFVKGMARGSIDRAIVTAMNDVAHSLGRYTVAEYVETPEVLRLLKVCGVDRVQGHYISEPLENLF